MSMPLKSNDDDDDDFVALAVADARAGAARYVRHERAGSGTYGVVYKGKDRWRPTCSSVALKFFAGDDETSVAQHGVSPDLLQEAAMMRMIPPHINVVRFFGVSGFADVRQSRKMMACVYECLHGDLFTYFTKNGAFADRWTQNVMTDELLRSYAYQLLRSLAHCHRNGVVHRDIKPQNVLIGVDGALKLADFGSARIMFNNMRFHPRPLSKEVCTLWYRAPEVLYAPSREASYGTAIDVWSAGCCVAEMFTFRPLLAGDNDMDQLFRIEAMFGPWPSTAYADRLSGMLTADTASVSAKRFDIGRHSQGGRVVPAHFNDLLQRMLNVNPTRRLTAAQCLAHPYFNDVRDQYEVHLETMHRHNEEKVAADEAVVASIEKQLKQQRVQQQQEQLPQPPPPAIRTFTKHIGCRAASRSPPEMGLVSKNLGLPP